MPLNFDNLQAYLTCTDHSVSGKKFDLLHDPELDLLITSPQPEADKLPEFYKSPDYISHTDSRKTLTDKVYQLVKNYMLQKKIGWINKRHPQRGKLLDIGAGTGSFLQVAQKNAWKIFGTEPNQKARELAMEKGIPLQAETHPFSGEGFDVITMWHVLEHVPDLEKQILELDRLLKKDGMLVIAVPNFKSYDAQHYKGFWAAYDVPRHLWHFSKTSIEKIFEEFGFELKETLPLKFDAYYVSLLSEKHIPEPRAGNTNLLRGFWTGFRSNFKARRTKQYSSHVYILKRS